jgi:hypothetical protein
MEISDDWPEYAVGPKDSLFAIGVASSNFTALEAVMQFIFATVLDLTIENSEMISAKKDRSGSYGHLDATKARNAGMGRWNKRQSATLPPRIRCLS